MMNPAIASSGVVHHSIANTITINTSQQLGSGMMSDGISEPSSPDSTFDASELMGTAMSDVRDDVSAQLAAAGPVGVAAAAAIASGRKKKRPHLFETNPSVRKRQQTRLLRKLKATIEEYTTRVGQQAIVLCCTPTKTSSLNSYKVFGSQPLENVIKQCKSMIMQELDEALAEQAPPNTDNPGVYDLPALALDGIPTPVDKMTQAQLRTFIPEMLKFSTARSKPGWGKMECRPIWWPHDVPWANVRSDVRTEEEKKRLSWTEALRSIVKNCYRHHGREDLLNIFGDDAGLAAEAASQYAGTMVQTINNPDGTLSIIQIDTGPNSVVTLPDGTQATVVHSMTAIPQDGTTSDGQVLAEQTVSSTDGVTTGSIELDQTTNSLANMGNHRVMLANGETAQITTDPSTGIMTIPVSIYQNLINTAGQNVSVELPQSTQMALAHLTQQQQQQQQQQLLATLQNGTGGAGESVEQEMEADLSSVGTDLVQQQQQLLEQQLQQQLGAGDGTGAGSPNVTVRVVSVEPKTENT